MKNISKLILYILCLTLIVPSCTDDFEELNTNPNDPEVVSPAVLLPYTLREGVKRMHGHTTRLQRLGLDGGMLWVQYFARNQYTNEGDTYFTVADLMNANWKGFYNETLINAQKIIEISQEEGANKNDNFVAVGLIVKSWMYSIITDTWGSVPYFEALDTEIINPKYDSQEAIYADILTTLKTASDLIDENGKSISGDILYGGDLLKWKKFANSLRLKLANRQAVSKPGESQSIIAEILSNPAQYPVFTGHGDQALLYHEARPSNNPWHEVMVFSGREDWSISQTLINKMTDGSGNPTDPRITVYANPATGGELAGLYAGAINGLPEAQASIYINAASRPGSYFTRETAPVALMTFSELLFIKTEILFDGDFSSGETVDEVFESAIKASFDQYELEMPDTYFADISIDKESIMTEKWKALFGQGIEAWTEYRRTGYPVLSNPDPNAIFENGGEVPSRLEYPNTEYSLNAVQLDEGIGMNNGPDDKITKMWWVE